MSFLAKFSAELQVFWDRDIGPILGDLSEDVVINTQGTRRPTTLFEALLFGGSVTFSSAFEQMVYVFHR